mgnify:FL=1
MPTARLAIMADDTNYGSLGALAPNWSDGERNIDTDEIYERFFEWVADIKGVEPWPIRKRPSWTCSLATMSF